MACGMILAIAVVVVVVFNVPCSINIDGNDGHVDGVWAAPAFQTSAKIHQPAKSILLTISQRLNVQTLAAFLRALFSMLFQELTKRIKRSTFCTSFFSPGRIVTSRLKRNIDFHLQRKICLLAFLLPTLPPWPGSRAGCMNLTSLVQRGGGDDWQNSKISRNYDHGCRRIL